MKTDLAPDTAAATPRTFSLGTCAAGVALIALFTPDNLFWAYFDGLGLGEGEGTELAQGIAWLLLLSVAVYAVAVAPLLWRRARSNRARLAVFAPHAALLTVGLLGTTGYY